MNGTEDTDMLAAEYVLGTLDHDERSAVAERRARDPALDAAIEAWEARLSPLSDHVEPATPSDLLPGIHARIDGRRPASSGEATGLQELSRLRAGVSRWRATALVSLAAAAGLAGLLIWQGPLSVPEVGSQDQRYVAVFQQDDQQPSFLLSIDLATRELTIRPVAAAPREDSDYQLWVVGGSLGSTPRSLGLLDSPVGLTRKQLDEFSPEALQEATFGISLEPVGGSPTGRPTGPAIHGTLIPVGP